MMKYIMYYYNLKITNFKHYNEKYYFESGKDKYIFEECSNEFLENYYYELEYQIKKQGYKNFAQIIVNKNGSLITYINQKSYVLIKNNIQNDKTIILDNIEIGNNIICMGKLTAILHYPWWKFWERKIDFFEHWIETKEKVIEKNKAIINFFIGLSENAVEIFNKINMGKVNDIDNMYFSLQHWRINNETSIYDYYDTSNIIIDHSSRDVGEYIKSQIITDKFDIEKLIKYINEKNLPKEWIELLYARILFPTYFYDEIEYAIANNLEFEFFDSLRVKIELLIKKLGLISKEFSRLYKIDTVEWLKKVQI